MPRDVAEEEEEGVEIELTPLIDCVFLLLIFFMVTTIFKNPQQLRMTLPEAEQATQAEEKKLIAEIDQEGRMALNGRPVTMDELDMRLIDEKAQTRAATVIIKTDKDTKHGLVLDVIQIAKSVGIETIVLATEEKKKVGT